MHAFSPRIVAGLAIFASVTLAANARAQAAPLASPAPPPRPQNSIATSQPAPAAFAAAIEFGGPVPLLPRHDGAVFERVALRPHQAVRVALAGIVSPVGGVSVQAPDGGNLSANALTPAADASSGFTFRTDQHAGIYRVFITTALARYQLRFLVVDPAHPLPADSKIPQAF